MVEDAQASRVSTWPLTWTMQALTKALPLYWLHVPKTVSTLGVAMVLLPGVCTHVKQMRLMTTANSQDPGSHVGWLHAFPNTCPGIRKAMFYHGYELPELHEGIDDKYDRVVKGHGIIMLRQPEQRIISGWHDGYHSWPLNGTQMPHSLLDVFSAGA